MEEIVKRGRGRPVGTGGNKREDLAVHTNKGDNTRYLRNARQIANLSEIDISDAKQVENRINEYFDICERDDVKPTVSGCSMALGIDRQTFLNWSTGKYRAATHKSTVKKAYNILDIMMEDYMMNSKINPVAGIFLMKNNHGYRDQTEITVTPNNPLGDETDAATLEQKYVEAAKPDDYCEAEGFEVE